MVFVLTTIPIEGMLCLEFNMRIYLATLITDKSQGQTLTTLGAKSRLLSYHYLKKIDKIIVQRWFRKGRV